MSPETPERPQHFVDARLDVLNRVYRSDAAVAKLLDVARSQPPRWQRGQLPDLFPWNSGLHPNNS
jgi:hypothetical protein